ncbi:hypothetical protein AB0N24_27195 [Arthrobacter sp. NPDC093128]|uniref:hypothetical protein n=1 Tax=Arthrobacter sp. NPDC093128 TaxID=3154979 RepID=UPI003416E046
MSENTAQGKFGNWLQPSSPDFFGLSLGGVVISAAGRVFGLLSLMRGLFNFGQGSGLHGPLCDSLGGRWH